MRFPSVEGSNLAGRRFRLPEDFEGRLNIVLVAFEMEHQADVDTWTPLVKQLATADPGVRYYELPTIWRMNPVRQWFIDSGMRMGIPDPNTRAATITLYLDRAAFCQALGLPSTRSIYVLLVDDAGQVLWGESGRFTEAKGEGLTQAVAMAGATTASFV